LNDPTAADKLGVSDSLKTAVTSVKEQTGKEASVGFKS
jgi:hypothetical protein